MNAENPVSTRNPAGTTVAPNAVSAEGHRDGNAAKLSTSRTDATATAGDSYALAFRFGLPNLRTVGRATHPDDLPAFQAWLAEHAGAELAHGGAS